MNTELLSEVNSRYLMALQFHREQADLFWFLSLPGYAAMHEYQLADESLTQRRVKRFIFDTYGVPVYDNIPQSANMLEPLTHGRERKNLTSERRWEIIKKSWEAYETWEHETLREYERIATELLASGDIYGFEFMGGIIQDVGSELAYVSNSAAMLSGMEWDMSVITDSQTSWSEKYNRKIRKLLEDYGNE